MTDALARTTPAHFEISPRFRRKILLSAWLLALMGAFFFAAPLFDADDPGGIRPGLVAFLWVGALLCSVSAFEAFRLARRAPALELCVDDEGLWPARSPRSAGITRWPDIARVRERPFLQRLDLLAAEGRVLARVDVRLDGFDALRALILARTLRPATPHARVAEYATPCRVHLGAFAVMAMFVTIGLYIGATRPLVGYGSALAMVLMLGRDWATTPTRLRFGGDDLRIDWPLRHRVIRRREVVDITLRDAFNRGTRIPEVHLQVAREPSTWRLSAHGLTAIELHQRLTLWLKDESS